jgi:hypothetical protein
MKHYLQQFFCPKDCTYEQQIVVKPFDTLAAMIIEMLPKNSETTTALRKILEARDCALRSIKFKY